MTTDADLKALLERATELEGQIVELKAAGVLEGTELVSPEATLGEPAAVTTADGATEVAPIAGAETAPAAGSETASIEDAMTKLEELEDTVYALRLAGGLEEPALGEVGDDFNLDPGEPDPLDLELAAAGDEEKGYDFEVDTENLTEDEQKALDQALAETKAFGDDPDEGKGTELEVKADGTVTETLSEMEILLSRRQALGT